VDGFAGGITARGTATGTLAAPRLEFEAASSPAEIAGRIRLRALSVRGSGTLDAHRLEIDAKGADYAVAATLEGGWRDAWRGRVVSLANRGRYPLELLEPVVLEASPKQVELGRLRAALGEGRIALERLAWTPGRIESAGQFSGLPAAWLVAAAGLGEQLRATLLLDGAWAIASAPALDGTLRVQRAAGDLAILQPTALELGLNSAALEVKFAADRVDATLKADAKLGAISAQARTNGIERASTLDAQAEVRLADLRVLAGPLPPVLRIGGRATLHASARGTLGEPELAARIAGDALTVHVPPYGLYLDDGVLRASLAGNTVRIEELSLRGGEGRLGASGTVPLTGQGDAALQWQAEKLQLLRRPDMRLVVSGEGSAAVREKRLAIEGKLRVDSGYFERGLDALPELGDDVVVAGRERGGRAGANVPLDLALHIDLGTRLKVREAGFDGFLRGELKLATAKDGAPQAFGRISAFDATYRAYGRTLAVDPGVLMFDGPLRNPALQIEAWRRNQEVPAGVRVTGNLEQPRVELISDPPLPEGAKLSWLVLGRAPTETTGADLAVLQTAASAMLGRGDSVPITTRIADAVGLDELAVRGSSQIESRVVAVGKRLSDRLYLSYEAGVGALAQNLVKIDLSLTQRISLRAQTGSSSGAGVYYRYSWD
jgi:translocation and assembly module TamB